MKRLIATLMICAATTASAGVYERVLYYAATNGVDATGKFSLRDDGQGVYIWIWNVEGLTKPKIDSLPSDASAMAWDKEQRTAIANQSADVQQAVAIAVEILKAKNITVTEKDQDDAVKAIEIRKAEAKLEKEAANPVLREVER